MSETKHTKLPWISKKCSCGGEHCRDFWIIPPGRFVQGSGFSKSDADFLTLACNSHHELLEELKDVVRQAREIERYRGIVMGSGDIDTDQADAVIAKAEGS